jgi:hypothetical protein
MQEIVTQVTLFDMMKDQLILPLMQTPSQVKNTRLQKTVMCLVT